MILSRRMHSLTLATSLLSALALAPLSRAQTSAQPAAQPVTPAFRQACADDFHAHCSGVPIGDGQALECLKKNASALSPTCKQAVTALGTSKAAAAPAATSGAGAAKPHGAAGGAAPNAAAPGVLIKPMGAPTMDGGMTRQQEASLLRRSCKADYIAHCKAVEPGEGRSVACLKSNMATLSPGCQTALTAALKH
jgi:hypothetical protein